MKTIKLFLLAAIAIVTGSTISSCTDYQDEIDALDKRVYTLEHLVDSVNKNIKALEAIVNAQADGWVIIGMAELPASDNTPSGYVINFGKLDKETGELSKDPADKKTITIYNGNDGAKGNDGKDGEAPTISVRQDPRDGNYYWVIDGEWLTAPDGNRVRVNGKDGKDGEDGKNGKDGKDGSNTAPIININDEGYWIVSTDDGDTWDYLTDSKGNPIKATGNDGKDGKDGKNGQNGTNGKDPIISSVTIKLDNDGNRYIVFTIKGGGGNGEDIEVAVPLKSDY